ncbi:hypothetical protein MAPG_11140 [Magnaporthiopsis poae ATCC 64411]|uniref:AAA+ ATPase domain-containing protein n=1 Tax=Magnaporthiopsis poae (strain ATCC 64411 / 73-15) TaxID=644358 RepID=A0A0C4EEG7_MAGP6|nr:hypothetical protein MAPG_11140 [Magnaporthiopsis poae ATCC 64411]
MADCPSPETGAIPSPVPLPMSSSAEDPIDAERQTDPPEGLGIRSKATAGGDDNDGDDDDDGDDDGSDSAYDYVSGSGDDASSCGSGIRVRNDEDARRLNTIRIAEAAWHEERRKNLVADWKFLDSKHFKHQYGPGEGLEIIEILNGQGRSSRGKSTRSNRRRKQKQKSRSKDIETEYIRRIRIQSPALILLLSHLSGNGDAWNTNQPRVFLRPFRTQFYYHPRMKEILAILEKRFGDSQTATAATDPKGAAAENIEETPDHESDSESDSFSLGSEESEEIDLDDVVSGDIANTATALQHVRKYVEFVEKHILPMWDRARGTTKRKVAFGDLWMSFRVGEILYRPATADSPKGRDKSSHPVNKAHQSAWRCYSIKMITLSDDKSNDDELSGSEWNYNVVQKFRMLCLYCYYIDYDGVSYLPVQVSFVIKEYEGEKEITKLHIYPLRFTKDPKKLMETFRKQGEHFHFVKTEKCLFYDGWTLTKGPNWSPSNKELASEHIDSNIIVDFLEGYKAELSLGQPSFGLETLDGDWRAIEGVGIRHWTGVDRASVRVDIRVMTQKKEWFGEYLATRHMKDNKFMRDWKSGCVTELHGEDLALLPRRVVAFALRERKFILADIHSIREVRKQEDVFRDLKIDPKHKQMIESLVKTHFQKQAMQRELGIVNLDQDLIRGKGAGLVLLLHGVPGVGKTATAEAIAQLNSKPLFTITCGDLGFEPAKVDESLRNIFRLAHLWDCVLLLDEADVFLSRREVYDLKRNALVSVFLRVLEYYSGILFLTTNRVGHLDEAFRSRIHISLYYPPLSEGQTVAIFDVNIRRLSRIEDEKQKLMEKEGSAITKRPKMIIDEKSLIEYARWHWSAHESSERWNGRQIRNAFQIAYSLAHWPNKRPALDKQGRVISQNQLPSAQPQRAATPGAGPKLATPDTSGQVPEEPLRLDYTHLEEVARGYCGEDYVEGGEQDDSYVQY